MNYLLIIMLVLLLGITFAFIVQTWTLRKAEQESAEWYKDYITVMDKLNQITDGDWFMNENKVLENYKEK